MSWFKQLRGRKTRLPSEAERPVDESPDPGKHPVYELRVGMDKETLLDRLGPPPKSMTDDQYFAGYKNATQGHRPSGGESWLYEDVPSPGHDIQIRLEGGVLETAKVIDTQQHQAIWSIP